jgi:histidine ammonia-lyase
MQLITSKKSLEINSVTDNPNIFIESDQIISGNFHGQPLALALDF